MNDAMNQLVGTISDLVANHEDVQRESQCFALQELGRTEIPDETDPLYQFYWELVSTYITKVLLQVAMNQRLIR